MKETSTDMIKYYLLIAAYLFRYHNSQLHNYLTVYLHVTILLSIHVAVSIVMFALYLPITHTCFLVYPHTTYPGYCLSLYYYYPHIDIHTSIHHRIVSWGGYLPRQPYCKLIHSRGGSLIAFFSFFIIT